MLPVLSVFLGRLLALALSPASQGDAGLIRETLLARSERLHNLVVDYEVKTKYTPAVPPEAIVQRLPGGGFGIMNTGTRITRKQFSVLDDRYMYVVNDESWDREVHHPDLPEVTPMQKGIYVRVPDRCEQFRGDDRGAFTYMGQISNHAPLHGYGELELSLGLRRWGAPDPLREEDIVGMNQARTDDGKVNLRGLNHEGHADEWLLDPDLGYAPVRYRVYGREDKGVSIEYTMEDYRLVDDVMLPFEVHGTWRAGPNIVIETTTVAVKAYRLNDPNNTPERYHIDWPKGTKVWDHRAALGFRATDDALKYIGDDRIAQIALDQMSKTPEREPGASEDPNHPKDSNTASSTQGKRIASPNEPRNVVVAASSRSSMWLWCSIAPLAAITAGGILYLRARRRHENPAS